MKYEQRLNKYRGKFFFIKNQLGGKECDTSYNNDIHRTSYIKDIRNFIPFERSVFRYTRKYPVCSYSMWNESHTQLYIPTPPEPIDKLYMRTEFYVRLIHLYYMDEGKEEHDTHVIMWSFVHKKWYNIDVWPTNDPMLNDLFNYLNIDDVIATKLFINKIYELRESHGNIDPNSVKILTDIMGIGTPSQDVLDEIERYSPEVVGEDYNEDEPTRFE
jgi:hypothetical protein